MDERIKEEICSHYCKYPALFSQYFRDADIANEEMLEEVCAGCPLNEKEEEE